MSSGWRTRGILMVKILNKCILSILVYNLYLDKQSLIFPYSWLSSWNSNSIFKKYHYRKNRLDTKWPYFKNRARVPLNHRLISIELMNPHFYKFLWRLIQHLVQTHEITRWNNPPKRFYNTFINTIYTGVTQADVTTAS